MSAADRNRIEQLVPAAEALNDSERQRLAEQPPAALAELVLESAQPWWRRVRCVEALKGQLPEAAAPELMACLRDGATLGELKDALLDLLAVPGQPHSAELLAWLRGLESENGCDAGAWYRQQLSVLTARARLHDLGATGPLTLLAADEWPHRRLAGETGVATLIEARGLDAVLRELRADSLEALAWSSSKVEHRLLGLRLLGPRERLRGLADSDLLVAREVAEMIASAPENGDLEALRVLASSRAPGHLWAIIVLALRGQRVKPLWEALGSPRFPLPTVPADVREAILREYAPGERRTDPRWLVEAACLGEAPKPDEAELLGRALEALRGAGLEPKPPVYCGEVYQQGSGTYYAVDSKAGPVRISTLGAFFSTEDCVSELAVPALVAAGFRHIDGALGATVFAGLCVYFFGRREPLCVGDLLFYWQD